METNTLIRPGNDKPFKEVFLNSDVVTYNFLFEDICSLDECPDGVIPKNKYLVLGDNRPESIDSRDKTFGLVDKSEIKGKNTYIQPSAPSYALTVKTLNDETPGGESESGYTWGQEVELNKSESSE